METEKDVRWMRRFSNYHRALKQLTDAVEIVSKKLYLEHQYNIIREGLIQCFEFSHELAWKVMKDYAEYQGITEIYGPRDAIRYGLRLGAVDDERWMDTIKDRNVTSHHYDDDTAQKIVDNIINVYYPLFVKYEEVMVEKMKN
ncbi:MAG: nucleotidyltransferase substrate binding protein [Bacteroidales bacterium]|nr:nucleotidyltransferase substrate binding protein [Bacteroidales bacterium]